MSIKLYDGFLLKPETNLFEFKRRFKNVCLKQALYSIHVAQVTDIVELFDRIFIHEDVVKIPRIGDLTETLDSSVDVNIVLKELASYHSWLMVSWERSKIHAGESTPDDVTGFLNVVKKWCGTEIVVGQHSSGKLLSYPFNFDEDLLELLRQDEAYECDFSYWNNSDKPDNVSEQEWKERRVLWEETFPKYYMSYYGIVLNFVESSDIGMSFLDKGGKFWETNEVPVEIFDVNQRATKIVKRQWMEKEIKRIEKEEGKEAVLSKIMSIYSSFNKHDPAIIKEIAEVEKIVFPLNLNIIFGDK